MSGTRARGNLFQDLEAPVTGESFKDLLVCPVQGAGGSGARVRIERTLSSATPEPMLYDQPQDEWVVLLQGRARLWVAGTEHDLGPGDFLFIPAHTRHRVLETSCAPPCLWLAVHIHGDGGGTQETVPES